MGGYKIREMKCLCVKEVETERKRVCVKERERERRRESACQRNRVCVSEISWQFI